MLRVRTVDQAVFPSMPATNSPPWVGQVLGFCRCGFELDPWGIMSGVSNHLTTLAYSSTVKTGLKWFKRRGFVAVSGGFRPAAAAITTIGEETTSNSFNFHINNFN